MRPPFAPRYPPAPRLPFRLGPAALLLCFLAAAPILPAPAGAAEPEPERGVHRVAPATSEVRVDGVLDEPAWESAAVLAVPYEWFPGDNSPAPVDTEVLLTFDDVHLYVGVRALDPDPAAIRAHLADRDTGRRDDAVGIELDTFDDRRRAYRFQVNPLGVQLDAQISDVDETEDLSWDAIWESAGRLTADGYSAEMAIPFKQLRFPRAESGDLTWGVLAYRDYPRDVFHQLKSTPNDRDLDCRVCQYESLTGLADLATGHNLELTPTVTADRTDRRPDLAGALVEGDEESEAGLTARWGLTSSVTLHATVNPDFSQVEADAAQLEVNERFALFFPEKRPFFLENADFFTTPFNAVFTRTVADPRWGMKLTGKEGRHAFGVFAARDEINNLILPGPESSGFASLGQEVDGGVVRYRRDVGRTSTLGALYTGREGHDGYHNHVYGVDGSLRLADSDTLRLQLLESDTRYPDRLAADRGLPQGSFTGTAWRLDYSHATRNWAAVAFYHSLDDGFRADSGFIPRVGYRQAAGIVQRTFWGGEGEWYRRFIVAANATRLETQEGELIEQGANVELIYRGGLQSEAVLGLRPNQESFRGATFDNLRGDLRVSLRPTGSFAGEIFLRAGEVIDFTNVRQADVRLVRADAEFRLGRHFTGDIQHEWQELGHRGRRYLTANLTQTTLLYHLSVRAFFRAILQYRDVDRVLERYDPEIDLPADEQELFSQLLFSYKLNARTVLFAGYSDVELGRGPVDLTRRSRTFFLKVGYAFLW